MFKEMQEDIISIAPLQLPLTTSDVLREFMRFPDIDVLPVKSAKNENGKSLAAIYFKECLPLLLGCSNGKACKEMIPGSMLRELRCFDVGLKDKELFESLKSAIENETAVAIAEGSIYRGMVSLKSLVNYIHKHEIKEAIMTNPLTGMPGNYSIQKEFRVRSGKGPFVACYVDLNDFKAFNDKYGWSDGDKVLKYTGALLDKACIGGHFAGHVGGDDFILFLADKQAETIMTKIATAFDAGVKSFYNDKDRNQGFMICPDRYGKMTEFPIMSLSLAACGVKNKCEYDVVSCSLAALKKQAKEKSKKERRSCYVVDRRVPDGSV